MGILRQECMSLIFHRGTVASRSPPGSSHWHPPRRPSPTRPKLQGLPSCRLGRPDNFPLCLGSGRTPRHPPHVRRQQAKDRRPGVPNVGDMFVNVLPKGEVLSATRNTREAEHDRLAKE